MEKIKLVPATPDTGWFDLIQKGQICLMCGLKMFHNPPGTHLLERCPVCGFKLTKIEHFGLIGKGNKCFIMTDPN